LQEVQKNMKNIYAVTLFTLLNKCPNSEQQTPQTSLT
jgi:hypothetical protein